MDYALVARQPIINQSLETTAYELLYRACPSHQSANLDQSASANIEATSQVVLSSFADFGLDTLTAGKRLFINAPRYWLTSHLIQALPQQHIVIEIDASQGVDALLLEAIVRLAALDYKICLDNLEDITPWETALNNIHFVKINLLKLSEQHIHGLLKSLHAYPIEKIAHCVETPGLFSQACNQHFDAFQGYFFSKPELLKQQTTATNRVVILKLICELQQPNITPEELEETLSLDLSLCEKLLKILNSAAFGFERPISAIREAIIIVGLDDIRRWAMIMVLSSIDNKPLELTRMALIRAKMCALLGNNNRNPAHPSSYFMVGLFSMLDALLDISLDVLLESLPIEDTLKAALIYHEGPIGEVLENVIEYQKGHWHALNVNKVTPHAYSLSYIESVKWTDEALLALQR